MKAAAARVQKTPRHMQSGGFLSRSVENCRVAVELSCRVTVEYLSSFLSSSIEARAQVYKAQGIVPSSEVSSVIGEFIFYCVRQILWARLMRWIVVRDRGVVYRIAKYTLPYRRQSGRRYRAL